MSVFDTVSDQTDESFRYRKKIVFFIFSLRLMQDVYKSER